MNPHTIPHQITKSPHLNGPLVDHAKGQHFLKDAFQVILEEALCRATDAKEKVCEWRDAHELRAVLDLELRDGGESHDQLLQRVRDVAKYSVKTNHPLFFNQLFAGVDYYALTGRFLTETLNTSQGVSEKERDRESENDRESVREGQRECEYTYEVAPVFVLMEDVVLSKLRSLVGWAEGDGIFCPGGSISNMFAMNVARYRAFPQVKQQGLWAVPRLAVFTSQEGAVPFLVCATSGTTIQGSFDPLDSIADVCERHGIWMHVDAAWGGSVLFSKKHSHLMKGIERADSVTWNPHKMLLTGLQCSVLLLKDTTVGHVPSTHFDPFHTMCL
ncbi:hypothetical protein JZ751_021655 [Albula glossodonta]|uniref:Cysteine sulfinic acid decarboxylase n=1 Tax=Albula glossodonta TaxID=121402 RepID=A0A8T2NIL1_9TELE|nr:hypothetical protein JZ751_021655 [Albula glossodonta]